MPQEILANSLPFDLIDLRRRFLSVAKQFAMTWQIRDTSPKKRVTILGSQSGHYLYDLPV